MLVTSSKSIEIELASIHLVIKAGGGRENSNLANRDLELLIPERWFKTGDSTTLSTFFFLMYEESWVVTMLGRCFWHWETGILDSGNVQDSPTEWSIALLPAVARQERKRSTCREKQSPSVPERAPVSSCTLSFEVFWVGFGPLQQKEHWEFHIPGSNKCSGFLQLPLVSL